MSETDYTYEQLESKIARHLTRKPDHFFTHRFLVNEISSEINLKDPVLLNKLKEDIGIVMRFLKKYDNFDVVEENGSLRVVYMTKFNDSNVFEIIDPPSEKEDDIPTYVQTGLAVAQFIIDNNLSEFFKQKDHKGNTALHYFMIHGDILRAKKLIKFDESILFDENSEGYTPIELITDIHISNSLLKDLLAHKISLTDEVIDIHCKLYKNTQSINEFKSMRDFFLYIILMYPVFYFFFTVVYSN